MTCDQAAYRVVIEPRGPAVLRTAEGAYPEGYRTAGSFWAVKLPPEVLASDMTHDSVTGQFLCADQDDAAAGLVRLRGFWMTARAAAARSDVQPATRGRGTGASHGSASPDG